MGSPLVLPMNLAGIIEFGTQPFNLYRRSDIHFLGFSMIDPVLPHIELLRDVRRLRINQSDVAIGARAFDVDLPACRRDQLKLVLG